MSNNFSIKNIFTDAITQNASIPQYNASQLQGLSIDPNTSTITSGDILFYDGTN